MLTRKRAHLTIVEDSAETGVELKPTEKEMKSIKMSCLPSRVAKHIENIRAMRAGRDAPVDTMGCDQLYEKDVDAKTKRYQILLSLMLSSQTKDNVTHDAMVRLHKLGCNMKNIKDMPEAELAELLKPVGMYRRKANFIKRTTEILMSDFDNDIPHELEQLCALPGVGPKMGLLTLETGWGITAGIAVDTHVHRISNWLEWVGNKPTKTPEATRAKLEQLFPKEMWRELNHLLVGFGQTICKPVSPQCGQCLNKDICAVGKKNLKTSKYFENSE